MNGKEFDFDSDRVLLTGPNGSGKSTLLRAIYSDPGVSVVADAGRGDIVPLYPLSLVGLDNFPQMLPDLNLLLTGKHLCADKGRIIVRSSRGDHPISVLSYGEFHALALIFGALKVAGAGNVVLVDTPEAYIHDSVLPLLMSSLERIVITDSGGQLIMASHSLALVRRYSASGKVVYL